MKVANHFREFKNGRIDMMDGSPNCISIPQYKSNSRFNMLEMWGLNNPPEYKCRLPHWWSMVVEQ